MAPLYSWAHSPLSSHISTSPSLWTNPPSLPLLLRSSLPSCHPFNLLSCRPSMSHTLRSTGTVRWFNAYKGFGFIAPDDGGDDLFVHHTSIRFHGYHTLSEGQPVEFLLDYAEDGRTKAVDVTTLQRSRTSDGTGRGFYGGRGGGRGYGGRYAGGNTGGDPYRYGRGGGIGRRGGGYGGGRYSEGLECYNCGRVGHLARDCYQGAGGGTRRRGGGRIGGGGGVCFHCGEEGHFARECPDTNK